MGKNGRPDSNHGPRVTRPVVLGFGSVLMQVYSDAKSTSSESGFGYLRLLL